MSRGVDPDVERLYRGGMETRVCWTPQASDAQNMSSREGESGLQGGERSIKMDLPEGRPKNLR